MPDLHTRENDPELAALQDQARGLGYVPRKAPPALYDPFEPANLERPSPPLEAYADEPKANGSARIDRQVLVPESVAEHLPPPRVALDWEALEGSAPPPREWALEHWLPLHHASLMAGRGGIGKTLLAQHLGTAMALGYSYVDEIARPLRVLLWAGEDDAGELWRRQIPIAKYFKVDLGDLTDKFFVHSYDAADITLAGQVFGSLAPTPMMAELTAQIGDYRIEYVFLDNIARIYGGNENDRHQVTQFLAWLTAACKPAGVCLLGHPSKGAGSEYSGSTAWEGAVRARLYLSDRLPDAPVDDDEEPDDTVRFLSRRKSNYSANDWRKLELIDGVLAAAARNVDGAARGPSGEFAFDIVRRAARKLQSMGMTFSASTRSPEYLPKLAAQYGLLEELSAKRMGGIMRDMLKAGNLEIGIVGKYPNRTPKTGLIIK